MDTAEGLSHHISSRFNADLEKVRGEVLGMGGLVEQQLERALAVAMRAELNLVAEVNRAELQIDALERSIDSECSRILATRSPAASDLRLVVVVLKLITDLERMGDEAQKMSLIGARLTEAASGAPPQQLRHLGTLVQAMVRDALDALARLDETAARAVMQRDRAIDDEYEALQRQSITYMMEDPRSIRHTLDVMWLARSLERVGDHAKNICEQVIFAALGTDVRHTNTQGDQNAKS